jgi:hypothetical protein
MFISRLRVFSGRGPALPRVLAVSTSLLLLALCTHEACALITGGEGNDPLNDPGWPQGAAAVFNVTERVAYWEGPPFGGGEYHADCRGDTAALNRILQDFAKISATTKRIVVHDGIGNSFWLNINNEPEHREAARIDWSFTVWVPASFNRIKAFPPDLRPGLEMADDGSPIPRIDVYAGGSINWDEVKVPEGIDVVDNRLVAHGFTLEDRTVLEGAVTDLESGAPLAAEVQLQLIETQDSGGYKYTVVRALRTDADGHWVIKNAPAGWYQLVAVADGYASRILGYGRFEDQPVWNAYNAGLAPAASVSGRVIDDAGQPLPGVEVRLDNVAVDNAAYNPAGSVTAVTGDDGRFEITGAPQGKGSLWLTRPGYVRPGLGADTAVPASGLTLTMQRAASMKVTVDFGDNPRAAGTEYLVNVSPEGGDEVGSWGGSSQIDDDDTTTFTQIPAGRYVLTGRPNPSSANQQTDPVTVDLDPGESEEVTLKAK